MMQLVAVIDNLLTGRECNLSEIRDRIEFHRDDIRDADAIAPLIAGVCLLGLFTLFESRTRDPMLPLGLFRRRNFAATMGSDRSASCSEIRPELKLCMSRPW